MLFESQPNAELLEISSVDQEEHWICCRYQKTSNVTDRNAIAQSNLGISFLVTDAKITLRNGVSLLFTLDVF